MLIAKTHNAVRLRAGLGSGGRSRAPRGPGRLLRASFRRSSRSHSSRLGVALSRSRTVKMPGLFQAIGGADREPHLGDRQFQSISLQADAFVSFAQRDAGRHLESSSDRCEKFDGNPYAGTANRNPQGLESKGKRNLKKVSIVALCSAKVAKNAAFAERKATLPTEPNTCRRAWSWRCRPASAGDFPTTPRKGAGRRFRLIQTELEQRVVDDQDGHKAEAKAGPVIGALHADC